MPTRIHVPAMSATLTRRFRKNVTGTAFILVTATWLAALFTGQSWWLFALLFGYAFLVPIVASLFGEEEEIPIVASFFGYEEEDGDADNSQSDELEANLRAEDDNHNALETLRNRYVRGELTEEQFERKLEQLLDTESLEDVESRAREHERETE